MSVRVTDNTPRIKIDTVRGANLALRFALDDIDRLAKPNTPKDKGNLRNDLLKQVSGLRGKIEWRKRYAAVQERGEIRGRKIRNYTTAGTGPHFAENAVKTVTRNFEKYLRKAKLL